MARRHSQRIAAAAVALLFLLASCSSGDTPTATPIPTIAAAPTSTAAPTAAPPSATPVPVPPSPTATPTATEVGTATPIPPPTATAFPLQAGWWDTAICYEVFVRSFYDSNGDGIGDLNGLTAKLDYLNDGDDATASDLGVNCLWLMPVMESPSYHGYDVTDYRKIEQDYGTNDDFKHLVAEAHKRGIQVIIDLVLNHTSVEHPWFKEAASDPNSKYHDWYIWADKYPNYNGPWDEQVWHSTPGGKGYFYGIFWEGMPDLNYRNPAVTQEAYDISRFWVEEMGVDGFRLDAIRHLIEEGRTQQDTPSTHEWLRGYYSYLHSLGRPLYTVGEVLDNSTDKIASYYPDQLDSFFEFGVADGILKATNYGAAIPYNNALATSLAELPYQRFSPLLTNHDQNRAMDVFGGDVAKAKIAATALLTLPGLPFMYYGEEIGMRGSKPDERIRTPMQWSGDAAGGFSSAQPWEPLQQDVATVNVVGESADPDSLLNLYRKLVQLHRAHPALGDGSYSALKSSDGTVAAFLRHAADEDILVLLNFGEKSAAGVTFSGNGDLASGSYQLETLLGTAAGSDLQVGDGGAISAYSPLPTLDARTGYIFKLTR